MVDLLYIGVRRGAKNPRVHLWWDVTGFPNDGTKLSKIPGNTDEGRDQYYSLKKKRNNNIVKFARPGVIYSFDKEEDSVLLSSAKFKGNWQNQEDVEKWSAENRANDLTIDADAIRKKDASRRPDLEALEPLRKAYQALNSRQQTILLGEFIQFITKPYLK
jgi:hypothetical protein